MIEPPSEQLRETLLGLRLCTGRDLRHSRRRVRRLARDLPAFDSVWIDALLQARKLTALQAAALQAHRPESLSVGPCVVLEQLGQGLNSSTYLARHREGNERCVLKLVRRPAESIGAALESLEHLVARLQGVQHPAIVGPHACLRHGDRIATVARYIAGPHLSDLLIRRGRMPPAVVESIARQLIDGLAALEEQGGAHGDICLWNIRLLSSGTAVLVDCGIAPAIAPELTIHAGLPPQRYDAVAPELIGTGVRPSSTSDVYALGCVLWHLLAGRPPYTTGDPLAKLAAHQSRDLDDLRQWAPDTPDHLAAAVQAFTWRDPKRRPQTFGELRETWRPARRNGRRVLARFHAQFATSAPRIPAAAGAGSGSAWPFVLTLLLVLTGAALTLFDQGLRGRLLRLPARVADAWQSGAAGRLSGVQTDASAAASAPMPVVDKTAILPLPGPDPNGVISLASAGPYTWSRIDAVGHLTLRGAPGHRPQIVVGDEPCRVVADGLTLENVHFRELDALRAHGSDLGHKHKRAATRRSSPMLAAQVQELTIRDCSFWGRSLVEAAPGEVESAPARAFDGVSWKPVDPQDHSGGVLLIRNTVFAGLRNGISLVGTPRTVEAENCLCLGHGAFASLAVVPRAGRDVRLQLNQVTLRQAETLLRWMLPKDATPGGGLRVEATGCVFDVAGSTAALFQFLSRQPPQRWLQSVQMTGEGSLVDPQIVVAAWIPPGSESASVLDPRAALIEGLLASPFEFAGPLTPEPADSVLASYQAPLRSSAPLGIDSGRLPAAEQEVRLPLENE